MNNLQVAGSPAPSPAKGKAGPPKKMAGRGITKKTARKNAAATKRGGGRARGGRGRNKTYDDHRVQAAYDRQLHLRDIYAEVASAIKPVLEHLADESIKQLVETPTYYQEVPEYGQVQGQLDERRDQVMRDNDIEFKARTTMATCEYQLNTDFSEKKFLDSFEDVTEDFLDACLERTYILEHLRNQGLPVTTADTSYNYIQKPNEVVDEQGTYVVINKKGIKIPYPSLTEENKIAAAKGPASAGKTKPQPPAKRKAENQPEGQPDPKKSAALPASSKPDAGEEASTPQPRHIKGLLAAENEPDGEPESNAPSPSPSSDFRIEFSYERGRKDLPDLPNGVSDPDKYGLRTVNRRGPRANNRVILPPFNFDDEDIGFRDSTNDSSRKATRGTRGRFLDKPNSRNLHLDRVITTYDCLEHADGDLDPELVLKHKLHPKTGLFLPDSINEEQDPKERVSGLAPTVVITPNGKTLQASRSVRGHNTDAHLQQQASKVKFAQLIKQFCHDEDIAAEDVTSETMHERRRHIESLRGPSPSDVDDIDTADAVSPTKEEPSAIQAVAARSVDLLLKAAAETESGAQNEIPISDLRSTSQAPVSDIRSSSQPSPSTPRASRPFDAVRDAVLGSQTSSGPVLQPSTRVADDTTSLSILADVATQPLSSIQTQAPGPQHDSRQNHPLEPPQSIPAGQVPVMIPSSEHISPIHQPTRRPIEHHPPPMHHNAGPPFELMSPFDHMIGHTIELSPTRERRTAVPAEHFSPHRTRSGHPAEQPSPYNMEYPPGPRAENRHGHQRGPSFEPLDVRQRSDSMIDPMLLNSSSHPPPPPNAFLQTALNPTPVLTHNNAPVGPPVPVQVPEPQPHVPMGRNPFSSHGGPKASPVLPPLRPARRETAPEPLHAPGSLPLLQQSPEFGSYHLGMVHTNSGNYYPPAPSRSFHQSYMAEPHPTLSIPPMGMLSGAGNVTTPSSLSPTGSLMMIPTSPTNGSSRGHRASISSGSNNAKYRRIAAAPIPHNRPWNSTGGAELRLAHYDHREAIKDYSADEPPPRTGPTTIRGWTNVNNVSKGRKVLKKEDSEEKEAPPSITTYISKWNPSDRGL